MKYSATSGFSLAVVCDPFSFKADRKLWLVEYLEDPPTLPQTLFGRQMDSPPTIAWHWSWAIFQYISNPCCIPGAAFKKNFKLIPVHDPKGRRCFLEVLLSWNCRQAGHMLSADPGHQPHSGRWREFPPALPYAPQPQVNLWSRSHWTVIDVVIVNAPLYG